MPMASAFLAILPRFRTPPPALWWESSGAPPAGPSGRERVARRAAMDIAAVLQFSQYLSKPLAAPKCRFGFGEHAVKSTKFSREMTADEFDRIYFYAAELKDIARSIGIVVGNLRKFEIETLIRDYLTTGKSPSRRPTMPRTRGQTRDTLTSKGRVVNYVGDKKTKLFLLSLVRKSAGKIADKSGQWYWLNDWRRKKQEAQAVFTYQDLADKLAGLMQTEGRLPQIPSARLNNFITDFRTDPKNAGTSRPEVLKAWNALKKHPGPKTYSEYRRVFPARR